MDCSSNSSSSSSSNSSNSSNSSSNSNSNSSNNVVINNDNVAITITDVDNSNNLMDMLSNAFSNFKNTNEMLEEDDDSSIYSNKPFIRYADSIPGNIFGDAVTDKISYDEIVEINKKAKVRGKQYLPDEIIMYITFYLI